MMTGKCILLIEDHPDSCEALRQMIARRGGKAECACTLQEGIIVERAARQAGHPFDCVISDLGLPGSTISAVLETLREFKSQGIPVRAITGVADENIIAQCIALQIPVILKGTTAESIMESVIYALAENPKTGDVYEVAKALLDNKEIVREVPAHTSWFFVTWPKWAQALTSLGAIFGVLGTVSTFSIATIKSVDAKAVARETVRLAAETYQGKVDHNSEQLALQGTFIRSLQDSKIEMVTQLANLTRSTTRIEDKIDGILRNDAKVNAMWKQRLERKTNADLGKEGVGDTPEGPSQQPPNNK